MRQQLFDGNNRHVAQSFYNVGETLDAMGKYREALDSYHQAFAMY